MGHKDRPLHERQSRMVIGCKNGHVEIVSGFYIIKFAKPMGSKCGGPETELPFLHFRLILRRVYLCYFHGSLVLLLVILVRVETTATCKESQERYIIVFTVGMG